MTTTDQQVVSETMAGYYEKAFSSQTADMSYLSDIKSHCNREVVNKQFTPITTEEVYTSLKWLRNRKCAGLDGVHNEMIKLSATNERDYGWDFAEILAKFFNDLTLKGEFPTSWKSSIIIPAYKKGVATDPANFRPICLLSCLSKVYTRLLNARVSKAAEEGGVFTNTQGGGRKF